MRAGVLALRHHDHEDRLATTKANTLASWRWLLPALSLALAAGLVSAGLAYGVEELVWDPTHQTYAYLERPHTAAVLWAAIAAAVSVVLWGCRQRAPRLLSPRRD